jgi:hypothetical protein
LRLYRKGHLFALLAAPFLVRRRSTESSVEGYVGFVLAGRPRLDVATAFSFGVRARTPSTLAAGDLV